MLDGSRPPRIGSRLGPHEITAKLGEAGMGLPTPPAAIGWRRECGGR
jgi:hypothetical protein